MQPFLIPTTEKGNSKRTNTTWPLCVPEAHLRPSWAVQTASLCKQKSIIQNIFQLCVPVLCHLGLMSPYTKPKCLVIDSALCALHPHRLDMFLLSFQPLVLRRTHQLQQLRSARSVWRILPDEMNTVGAKTHSIIFTQGQSMGEFLGHDNDETPLLLRRYHPPASIVRAKFIGKKKKLSVLSLLSSCFIIKR